MIPSLIILSLLFTFLVILFYKLSYIKWFDEFVFGELTGKDWFTRLVKFLIR